jgi:hypothetical protein
MTPDHPVAGGHVWVASGLSIAVLVIATWGVFGLDAKILGKLVLGADNRASTSKFQATAWTYALLFALVTLLVGHLLYADFDAGWDAFLNDGLNTDYLWLLGIPSAGLVGAKAITQSKAQANPAAKPTKPAADPAAEAEPTGGDGADPAARKSVVERLLTRTRELASDDNDDDPQPALGDLQYLVFNAVAIAFFLSAFLGHVELGLPSLPDTLIALTGVSAASYLSTKAVRNAAPPVIVSVRPSRVVLGAAPRPLDVAGSGFLGATGKGDTPSAMLGGVDLLVEDGATAEHLTAIVPAAADAAAKGLEPGKLPLVILTPAGQASEPTTIDLLSAPA